MTARRVVVLALLLGAVVVGVALVALRPPALALDGLPKGEVNAAELRTAVVSVDTAGRRARLLLDGRVVDRGTGRVQAPLAGLADGGHVLRVEVDRGRLPGRLSASKVLRVDTAPPVVRVQGDRGTSSDVLHLATSDGRDVEVEPDGGFVVPAGAQALVAYDDAGNRTDVAVVTGR
ncbi:MAG: hypothetical protein JWO60_287 [Frankiales bacterium]|nr:hypothetical protein [Frankiales bacterium]